MTPKPLVPRALAAGGKIALISPSARLNDKLRPVVERAKDALSRRGYSVWEIFTSDAETSVQHSISCRLSELRTAFSDPDTSAIICTIGGSTFTELLPALIADTELHSIIRANPKIVVGYSDITGLHWFLHALTGLRTFYGPGIIPELGEPSSLDDESSPRSFCSAELFRAIAGTQALGDLRQSSVYAPNPAAFFLDSSATDVVPELAPNSGWIWIRPGKAQGRIFGGCLTVMARLQGVRKISPDWRGRIVFFETAAGEDEYSGNPLYRVQAAIADLIAQGVFEEAAGLVVGRPYGYNSPEMRAAYVDVIRALLCEGRLAEKKFPILFNVDIGHTTPMVTLPMDALASLDSESNKFAVLEPGVN
jgi:muramoyltetrapeptide carboxypeptidase LdcA involved in peptidoglycan recycling